MKNERVFLSPPHMSELELEFVKDAFESNYIAPVGPMVDAFERELSEAVGISHVVALSSGTAAMHLVLKHLNVSRDDVVLASTLTFIGSVSHVAHLGANLVFIDCDRKTWNMDPNLLAEELQYWDRKGKLPKAVIPTDLYGQCADLDTIQATCSRFEIPVICDAAESLGARYKGRPAGNGGAAAVYSFNGNKIITTSGGGALASEDADLIEHARKLATQAREAFPHYEHNEIGFNYRMSNVLAAIGRGQLRVLNDRIRRKHQIFDLYKEQLGTLPGIEFMPEAEYGVSSRWLTVILIDPEVFGVDADSVRETLEVNNIEARPIWKPMHLQPVFTGSRVRDGKVAEDLFSRGLCLPSGTGMLDATLERISDIIKNCSPIAAPSHA